MLVQCQSLRLEFSIGNLMVNFDVRKSVVMHAHHVVSLEKAPGTNIRWLEPDEAKGLRQVLRGGRAGKTISLAPAHFRSLDKPHKQTEAPKSERSNKREKPSGGAIWGRNTSIFIGLNFSRNGLG